MKITIKNRIGLIQTDNPELLKTISDLYSFKSPGYQYTSMYRNHRWDGSIRLVTALGKFKAGLLSDLLDTLKSIGCEPDVEFDVKPEPILLGDLIQVGDLEYYEYQADIIKKSAAIGQCIIKSPTGSGKTLIMAGLLVNMPHTRCTILFNSKQLVTQTYKFLTETCGLEGIGLCYGDGFMYANTMLATVQSLDKLPEEHRDNSDLLMVDECHEFCNGATYLAAINGFQSAKWRFGFTATVPNAPIPKFNLIGAFGKVLDGMPTAKLVNEGFLTKPIIQVINIPSPSGSGGEDRLQYIDAYAKYIVNNDVRNGVIHGLTTDICNSKPSAKILILVNSINHGNILRKLIKGSAFIDGSTEMPDRYTEINKFKKKGDCQVLIGSKILQTGVSIDHITHFINARGMKSEIATIQALGRALRKHKSKSVVYIYDFYDNEKYLNKHSKERINSYKREGHEVTLL